MTSTARPRLTLADQIREIGRVYTMADLPRVLLADIATKVEKLESEKDALLSALVTVQKVNGEAK